MQWDLKRESRLSYSRFSAYEDQRAFYQTSPQDSIHFSIVERYPAFN
jgi:hypothetical protein